MLSDATRMTLRISNFALFRRVLISAGLVLSSVLAAFALIVPEIQAASTAMSSSYLNLRTGPATTTTIELIVPPGAALTVSGDAQAGYFPVVYGEQSGWVATDLVQVEMRTEPAAAVNFDETQLLPDGTAKLVESLNLRTGPGTDYDAIQVIDAGAEVEATGEISGAYEKVKFGGKEGWVRSVYVDRGPEPEGDEIRREEILATVSEAGRPLVGAGVTMVTDAEIVLRQQPTHDSTKIAVVPVDATVTLTGNEDKGYLEAQFDGKTGWVASGYMRQTTIPAGSPPDVPVLMYHSIQENGAEYQVTAAQLEEQLQWLSQNGYESITSADLLAWMTYGVPLPEKPVIISIDDGNSSDWLFLELLERYGFEGVFSLPNYAQLSASQIRTLDRAGEVCGHTVSHENLSTLDYDGQYYQIVENKTYLEKILGNQVTCFAYPFGAYNGLTPYVVIEAGYLMAFDVSGGPQGLDSSLDRWHILRINVNGNGTLDDFIANLEAY
jgi:uncharacterized protein YraI/peptidoglycan/xylan/chitin deacetylase (PgdA/CDA1 family)